MRNRAKCRLCNHIIESFHSTDYVICRCGEIALNGGEALYCMARDWDNFIRIDEDDKELPIVVREKAAEELPKPDKKQLLGELSLMLKSFENLPEHALIEPVTQYDLYAGLALLSAILRCD